MNLTWVWQQHPEWRLGASASRAERSGSLATRWPTRLSPDVPEVQRAAIDFLTDLAVYAPLDGVVFDRDAAMASNERLTLQRDARPRDKADAIDELTSRCREAVRAWRPECRFGRSVDADVVDIAGVHEGVAQDYARIVRDNDIAIVVAEPWRDNRGAETSRWVERIGRRALDRARKATPAPPTTRTLVEVSAFDRDRGRWMMASDLTESMAALKRAKVTQLGVGPVTPAAGDLPTALFDAAVPQPLTSGEAAR
jgi:hypothetical protein